MVLETKKLDECMGRWRVGLVGLLAWQGDERLVWLGYFVKIFTSPLVLSMDFSRIHGRLRSLVGPLYVPVSLPLVMPLRDQ